MFSHSYNRKLRVMDIYIRVVMPFLFSFIKLYMDGNPKFESIKRKRDIAYRNITPDDVLPGYIEVNIYFKIDIVKYSL